ncbi:MAG: hypothetical protein LBF59_05800 [Prevotellaceae bacterium]|nr:hypothetical protein [Prevotellaceae bacterium]
MTGVRKNSLSTAMCFKLSYFVIWQVAHSSEQSVHSPEISHSIHIPGNAPFIPFRETLIPVSESSIQGNESLITHIAAKYSKSVNE